MGDLTCPHCGETRDIIGIEIPEVFDGVLFWDCDRCGRAFHRWPEGDRRWLAAGPYVRFRQPTTPTPSTTTDQSHD